MLSQVSSPRLPSDAAALTLEFLQSRFWIEVMKPQLDFEIAYAEDAADAADDPTACFRWNKWGAALRKIKHGWIEEWSMYRSPSEEEDKDTDSPIY